jgi:uncharacterized protein (TIGR03382 family)
MRTANMRNLLFGLIATTSLLAPSLAHADQCAWVSKTEAVAGARTLGESFGARMLEYCEPCGDTTMKPITVKSVAFSWADESHQYFQVKVNGKMEDLAYVYVQQDTNADGKPDTWQNLAEMAGCATQDVTASFPMDGGAKFDEATDEDFSDDTGAGGCNASGGSSTSLFAFGALGLATVLGRRRRR